MSTLFLSHSRKDKAFVEKLAQDLNSLGIGVWFDKWEILAGDSIIDKISDGIQSNDYLAIILSPNSVNSPWVKKELNAAMMNEIDRRKVVVIPILYKSCDIPLFLSEKKYINFRKRYKDALSELVFSIQQHEARKRQQVTIYGQSYDVPWITMDLFFEILLLTTDGSLARVTKTVQNLAVKESTYYVHQIGSDGPISDFSVHPGTVQRQYFQDGRTFVKHGFGEAVKPGQTVSMSISYTCKDSFMNDEEYWATIANIPTKKITLKIVFPNHRPPRTSGIFKEVANVLVPESSPLRLRRRDSTTVITWGKNTPPFMQRYRLVWTW